MEGLGRAEQGRGPVPPVQRDHRGYHSLFAGPEGLREDRQCKRPAKWRFIIEHPRSPTSAMGSGSPSVASTGGGGGVLYSSGPQAPATWVGGSRRRWGGAVQISFWGFGGTFEFPVSF